MIVGYNKVTLYGQQTCDYLCIQTSCPSDQTYSYVNSEAAKWTDGTLLYAKFDNNFLAGNTNDIGTIEGYEIRRQADNSLYTEYVGTIKKSDKKYMLDYSVKNNLYYKYFIYPTISNEDKNISASPFVTDEIKTDWGYWSLLVVDETDEEDVFYLNKLFKFELNFIQFHLQ